MFNLLKDIHNGKLTLAELPDYALYLLGQAFWPAFIVIAAAAIGWMLGGLR